MTDLIRELEVLRLKLEASAELWRLEQNGGDVDMAALIVALRLDLLHSRLCAWWMTGEPAQDSRLQGRLILGTLDVARPALKAAARLTTIDELAAPGKEQAVQRVIDHLIAQLDDVRRMAGDMMTQFQRVA